ncbi:flagellar basal body P-ring formation chaperone FlgA [Aporhodopirellula aestuarii]|uniref:Flagellar basal body P-ring formation chaperone FlgA n=1 Tax=Aporhodopirellula aestuarii TaxID=2950107 RepID=A0ABT0U0R6_9BACT|nr:flagellar basal body P-ring formation chaperone FlgA [Aporhodopirellula aestuarii]MCM2370452.1 flagellar basal body P-ring formation chaperone FlgA [Aporhodopirellula aestuarii]
MSHESVIVRIAAMLLAACTLLNGTRSIAQQTIDDEMVTPLYSSHRGSISLVPNVAPESSDTSPRVGMIDENTKWQFVSRESITLHGSLIRLKDVIRPLEPNLVAWQRLADSTIGLMPVDGSDAKISRDRLAQLIARAEATPSRIKIYGPETIVVRQSSAPLTANAPKIIRTGYSSEQGSASVEIEPMSGSETIDDADIDHELVERLQQYVLATIRNQFRDIYESFEIEITFDPEQLDQLKETQGVRHLSFVDEVPAWSHEMVDPVVVRARIHGRAVREDCKGIANLTLKPYPGVVTARQSLQRGQRVSAGDLHYQPYSNKGISLPADVVRRPEDIIDMEVVGLIRGGVPLSQSGFAPPRVIRRGDLLEVQVGGGGIRVTTAAKSLSDGAIGDLIEIETLSPKRRLLAKVVHSSLVEIMTQAPHVRAEPSSNSSGATQR